MAAFDNGLKLEQQGKYAEALAAFQEAVREQPDSSLAWTHLGAMLQATGDMPGSLGAFDRALQIDPQNAFAWEGKGRGLTLLGDYQAAIAACDRALALNPNLVEAHYARGCAFFAFDDKRSLKIALQEFDRALSLNPNITPNLWRTKPACCLFRGSLATSFQSRAARLPSILPMLGLGARSQPHIGSFGNSTPLSRLYSERTI